MLFGTTSGQTADFILGQIYASRAQDVIRDFSSNDDLRIKKEALYLQKNCALLGR
jgi:hypothetical protein